MRSISAAGTDLAMSNADLDAKIESLREDLRRIVANNVDGMVSLLSAEIDTALVITCGQGPTKPVSYPLGFGTDPTWHVSQPTVPASDVSGAYTLVSQDEVSGAYEPLGHKATQAGDLISQRSVWAKNMLIMKMLNIATCIAILGQVLAVWYEIETMSVRYTDSYPLWLNHFDAALCIWFTLELLFRLYVKGVSYFTTDVMWHTLQVALVVPQLVQTYSELTKGAKNPVITHHAASFLDAMQIVRLLHLIDLLDFAAELHLLLTSIAGSLSSLTWALMMILVSIWMYGIIVSLTVSSWLMQHPDVINGDVDDGSSLAFLLHFFGSFEDCLLTLFFAISSGLSWSDAIYPLRDQGFVWLARSFLLYVALVLWGGLNILAGVFVNSAMAATSAEVKRKVIEDLKTLFRQADADMTGTLHYDEFEQSVLSNVSLAGCFESLGIDKNHARILFNLLDKDGSGEIQCDEFVEGCIRLHGASTAIDLASFKHTFDSIATTQNTRIDGLVEKIEQFILKTKG